MLKSRIAVLLFFVGMITTVAYAQTSQPVFPSLIGNGTLTGISQPLKDIPPLTNDEYAIMNQKAENKVLNKKLRYREYPFASTASPKGDDPAWQKTMGQSTATNTPLVNFDGQSSPYFPPDCNGTVGPNHYMQTVNSTYAIYSKTGTLLAGPTNMNLLFGSVAGSNCNDGDPLILYDDQASRWLAVEFSLCGSNDRMLVAVSTTSDPTGTWYQYSFDVADMPDYEKFGIWQDGYYMATNNGGSNDTYVFERSQMIAGGASPQMVGFTNAWLPGSIDGFMCVPPVDNDGAFAPAGSPGLFIAMNDDAIGGGSDQLWIYELAVNWSNTAASTFNRVQQLNVPSFDSNFGNNWTNIKQPGTSQELDAIPQVIMNVPQYRNFGSYQTIVCCHSVDVDATDHAGIRWYELRKTSGSWTLRQSGTYAPDAHSRWMGSISLNANNKIGLGYSISSTTEYPGIRYTGQSASAYAAGNGLLDVPESVIHTGAYSQTSYERWGDYALMSVDPVDNETFWFTTEYIGSGGSRKSKVASFKIGNTPVSITLDATNITSNSATLNGTVNPNSLSTSYHFEWGTTIAYGNNTSTINAGAGTSNIVVNAPVSGLVSGTTYHFRLVAVNADGTSNGNDLTFVPGGAVVTTTAVSAITVSEAVSGGNVVADGGSAVSARGVCWSTSANPVVTGSHTTDGSGTGTFASLLTGLTANTTYHVRAYATNANGTFYGSDLTFTTLCSVFTLPFTESFSGTTIPNCWTQVDNQGNGQIWQFGTITGQSPNPALTGNYAYLNSDAYGSGSSQNADLLTPSINLTAYSTVNLQFKHYFKSYSGSSGTLSYSINNGTSWNVIQTFTSTSSSNPVTFNQSIAAVAGQAQVKFKWNYTGTYGYYWGIDDINITGTSAATLTVSPSNQAVDATAGSVPFTVSTTAASWTASSNAAWCTVTPSGTGNGTLTATYTQNTGGASRVASITVSAPGASPVVVTVTQSPASSVLTVSPSNQDVTSAAGNTSFNVTSNTSWTAVSNAAWCNVTPSGTGDGTIVAAFSQNTNLTSRIANITVSAVGLPNVVVTVTQAAGASFIEVTPGNQNVSAVAGNTSFTVTSNTSWTVASNSAWCTVSSSGSGNGTISVSYSANALITSRIASITVTASGVSPVVVTVTQSGTSPTLSVSPANQNVGYSSGNTSFTIVSNSAWSVLSDATWCEATPSGSGNGTITVDYDENTALTQRVAYLTITVAGLPSVNVTVTQAAAPVLLTVTPYNQNVPSSSGEAYYTVTCNSPWTATSNTFWCEVTPSGSGNGILVATYEANSSLDQRISYFAVSAPGASNANFMLTQAGAAPFLSVDPHLQNVGYQQGTTSFTVSSNLSWTATSDASWCTVTPSGNGNGTITATFNENTVALARTANIMVLATGQPPVMVTVVQQAPVAILNVTPSQRTVTDIAGLTSFSVSSNTNWSCSSDASWCTVTSSGSGIGEITANYTQNLTQVIRTANIVVSGTGVSPVTVQVIQLPSFVSITDNPEAGILLFPNPTSGVFTLKNAENVRLDCKVSVLNAKGKLVYIKYCKGSDHYDFDLSQAAAGNYYLKIESDTQTVVKKLVIN